MSNHVQSHPDAQTYSSAIATPPSFNDAPLDALSAHYSGRQEELTEIVKSLDVVHGDIPRRCVLYGDHGVGKTQLCLTLAQNAFAQGHYTHIFWISASTIEQLYQGFSRLLSLVAHPLCARASSNSEKAPALLTAARRWLEDFVSGRWLFVLDNVAEGTVDFLVEHLPRKNGHGNILFTTSSQSVAVALAHVSGEQHGLIKLGVPRVAEAARLLLRHFNGDEVNANANQIEETAKCVGCLPLALAQVVACVKHTGRPLYDVLTLLNSNTNTDTIRWENDLSIQHQRYVVATFSLQLETLQRQAPDASNLLKIFAFLDPEGILLDILVTAASAMSNSKPYHSYYRCPTGRPSFMGRIINKILHPFKSPTTFTVSTEMLSLLAVIQSPTLHSAIAQLQDRSLVQEQRRTGHSSSSVHIPQLVQLIVLDRMKTEGTDREWFDRAVDLVFHHFEQMTDPLRSCEALLPHIESLTTRSVSSRRTASKISLLCMNYTRTQYLHSCGRYGEAEDLGIRVSCDREVLLGSDREAVLAALNELAEVYVNQRETCRRGNAVQATIDDDAEAFLKQVLSTRIPE